MKGVRLSIASLLLCIVTAGPAVLWLYGYVRVRGFSVTLEHSKSDYEAVSYVDIIRIYASYKAFQINVYDVILFTYIYSGTHRETNLPLQPGVFATTTSSMYS